MIGLQEKILYINGGPKFLHEIYHALKVNSQDVDSVVKFHCEIALAHLDEIMRSQIFIQSDQGMLSSINSRIEVLN